MARRQSAPLFDFLISAVCWVPIVFRSGLVCCYRGAGQEVRSLLLLADGDRLRAGIVFGSTARKQDYHLGGLPLVAYRDEAEACPECPSFFRIDYRQGLLGVTGGVGVVFEGASDPLSRW